MNDIDWALIAWAQSPAVEAQCEGRRKYYQGRKRSLRCAHTKQAVRETPEGVYCLACWSLLPTCDICQRTKATLKHVFLSFCTSCYNPDLSEEYLAYSASFALSGESLGDQLEMLGGGRYFTAHGNKAMNDKLKDIGVPAANAGWNAPLEVAEVSREKRESRLRKLQELRAKRDSR